MKIVLAICLILVTLCNQGAPLPRRHKGCRARRSTDVNIRIRKDNVIDLSFVTNGDSAYWPTSPTGFEFVQVFKGYLSGFFYSSGKFSQPEHLGTHMDAPIHFAQDGNTVDQVSLESLIGIGVLLDVTTDGNRFNESLVTIDHFLDYEEEHGQIRSESIILLRTGYGDFYHDRPEYLGTDVTGVESIPYIRFPGLHPDAAEWLVENRCIFAIGIDTPSIDEAQSKDFMSHRTFAAAGIPIIENIANLDKVAESMNGFKVIALPYNIEGATGSPIRIIAVVN